MADITLEGREINFDLKYLSIRKWRELWRGDLPETESDAIISRVTGLTPDEVGDMSYPDFRLLLKRMYQKGQEPLADPN